MCAQPNHAEILVAVDDRLGCAPLEIKKITHRDEVDLGGEGRIAAERKTDQTTEQGDVVGRQRVPAWSKEIKRLAIPNKDRLLRFAHHQLGTEPKFAGPGFRHAMDDLVRNWIWVLDKVKNRHRRAP